MANLKDVARAAGVSLGTASRVINGAQDVREGNRLAVQRAVEALGYRPNAIARSLKVSRSLSVGMLIPDISSPYYPAIVRGAQDVATSLGYSLLLINTDRDERKEIAAVNLLVEKQIDGILYVSNTLSEPLYRCLRALPCPVILVSTRDYAHGALRGVGIDNRAAARDGVLRLLGLGHRRIALLAGPDDDPNAGLPRTRGYFDALAQAGIAPDDALIARGNYNEQYGCEAARHMLRLPQPPTAIFAVADRIAMGVCNAARELDVRVPEQLAVLGFDGLDLTEFFLPHLSTVSIPRYEMGMRGMGILSDAIAGNPPDTDLVLRHEVLLRDSTGQHAPPIPDGHKEESIA